MFQPKLLSALVALVAALKCAQAYIPPGTPSYTDLSKFNGQWSISVFINRNVGDPASSYTRHTCNTTVNGAACNQPSLQEHTNAAVKIVWTLKNATRPFTLYNNGTPVDVLVRLNYMPVSQTDRGWRKKNQAYPEVGFHAKWKVATMPFNVEGGEAVWNLADADEVTDGLLYPEVCVECTMADGTKHFCQCDRLNNQTAGGVTVETTVEGSITPAMRGSAIALSAFAPLLLFVYIFADNRYYAKHGRALQCVHINGN